MDQILGDGDPQAGMMSKAQAWETRASRLCDKAYYDALKQSREVGDEDPASVQQRTFRNLHGQIGDLCRELACYEPSRDKEDGTE